MKKSLSIIDNQLSDLQIRNLTNVIRETIALDAIKLNQQIFTSADLWNIQRNLKPRSQRKFL